MEYSIIISFFTILLNYYLDIAVQTFNFDYAIIIFLNTWFSRLNNSVPYIEILSPPTWTYVLIPGFCFTHGLIHKIFMYMYSHRGFLSLLECQEL